jgi:hypothetical protein
MFDVHSGLLGRVVLLSLIKFLAIADLKTKKPAATFLNRGWLVSELVVLIRQHPVVEHRLAALPLKK